MVEVPEGKLRGYRNGAIHVFKGIPYGAPTGGANRFLPPKPALAWSGVRDATSYGPSSPQRAINLTPVGVTPMARVLGWGSDLNQSEDCLVLNVWTPGLDHGRRPVMFRIHGGGFTGGSGSWPQSDGTAVAHKGNVVVVTVNHRLGALGYLDLSEFAGPEYATSGNAGMLDLVQALRWVNANIRQFGGDPDKVMIFGESGGGAKVSALLAMPAAKGLFRAAIVESGPMLRLVTRDRSTKAARQFLDKLGVGPGQIEKLRAAPVADFVQPNGLSPVAPILDGQVFPAHPEDAFAAGASAEIPLLIGSNQTETTLHHLDGLPSDDHGVKEKLRPVLGARTDAVVDGYRRVWRDLSPGDLLLYIDADKGMRTGSIRLAESKLAVARSPVFMYLLAWRSNELDGRLKAVHGLEVPLTMDNVDSATALTGTPGARELADRMSSAWIAFARNGDPNCAGLPAWPRYTLQSRATMVFDNSCRVVNDPFGERELWRDAPVSTL
ncbi:MAG: carboxylesterase/lipase family protein [Caulobacteraceae bacterium]|nr:carboxylesterase/lipase family protein [Caulobacteraceae bacterium]